MDNKLDSLLRAFGMQPPAKVKPIKCDMVDLVQKRILNSELKEHLFHYFMAEGKGLMMYEILMDKQLPAIWWDGRRDE
jgi:hypothetical protein